MVNTSTLLAATAAVVVVVNIVVVVFAMALRVVTDYIVFNCGQ